MSNPMPSTDRRVAQIRQWIVEAERDGARSAEMTLHLTWLDRSGLTRSPDVALDEIRFADGGMTFLGVAVAPAAAAASRLERQAAA